VERYAHRWHRCRRYALLVPLPWYALTMAPRPWRDVGDVGVMGSGGCTLGLAAAVLLLLAPAIAVARHRGTL
jgi:Synergist-CTERM protein sorting domain-containing protein